MRMHPNTSQDEPWMRHAMELALRARGCTRPNPLVGCVIVRDGGVLAEGHHARAGEPHAEAAALAARGSDARGATMYVTLEPCNHHGRTPPCTEAILGAGITRVVVGARDPNPMAGGGADRLRAAGVDVVSGVLGRECWLLNPGFHIFHAQRRPLVTLKWAMTADGCTSAVGGDSRWISSEASRVLVHELRASHDAVLVGIETAVRDQARLSVRGVPGANLGPPRRRIVLDSTLSLASDHALVREPQGLATIVCAESACAGRESALRAAGADVWRVGGGTGGRLDLRALMEKLAEERCHSLLVEGGRRVAGSFVAAGLVDRVMGFVAPALLGGGGAHLGGLAMRDPPYAMDAALRLHHAEWGVVGCDALLTGWLKDPF